MRRSLSLLLAWLAATALTAVLGSLFHTHHSLSALRALGVDIPISVQARSSVADLLGFAPSLAALVAGGFVVAFSVTGLLRRHWPGRRPLWFAAAGAITLLAMVMVMEWVFGLTALAIARSADGIAMLMLAGTAGGLLFDRVSAQGTATDLA